jgi:NAD+ synthase
MDVEKRVSIIKSWIVDYVNSMPKKASTLVVGVSGGIDSAVVSTISSMTGLKQLFYPCLLRQIKIQDDLSKLHCNWLEDKFKNTSYLNINLDECFYKF